MPKFIEVRKLAAVDMLWMGPPVLRVEYAVGVLAPRALGALTLRSNSHPSITSPWQVGPGAWLVANAANYILLFTYALLIARSGAVRAEGEPELPHVRRYGVQQPIILIQSLVVLLTVARERRRRHPMS
jgi:hypothetical protein